MLKKFFEKIKNYLLFPARQKSSGELAVADRDTQTASAKPKDKHGHKPLLGRLDRYIIVKFISPYIFLIAIIIVIAVIFDFNENIDKLTQSHASALKIFPLNHPVLQHTNHLAYNVNHHLSRTIAIYKLLYFHNQEIC